MGSGTVSSINPNCLPSSALPAFNRQPASLSLPFQPFQPPTPQILTRLYSSSSTNSYLSIISWPNLQRQFFCNSQPITDQLLSFILFSLLYHLFSFILFPSPLLSFILSLYSLSSLLFLFDSSLCLTSLFFFFTLWFLTLVFTYLFPFFLFLLLFYFFLFYLIAHLSSFSLSPITCHFPSSISSTHFFLFNTYIKLFFTYLNPKLIHRCLP